MIIRSFNKRRAQRFLIEPIEVFYEVAGPTVARLPGSAFPGVLRVLCKILRQLLDRATELQSNQILTATGRAMAYTGIRGEGYFRGIDDDVGTHWDRFGQFHTDAGVGNVTALTPDELTGAAGILPDESGWC